MLTWRDNPDPTGEVITSTARYNGVRYDAIKLIDGGYTLDIHRAGDEDFKRFDASSIAHAKLLALRHIESVMAGS